MATPAPLDALLTSGRTLRPVESRLLSALPDNSPGALYDRHAAFYDRLIGNRLYNRLVWNASPADYAAFAAEAVAAADGIYLDAGCGTLVFTAAAYRTAQRPLVLVDRSLEMLHRAAAQLGDVPSTLVQADLLDLPFAPHRFATVSCFAMLHVLGDPWSAVAALRSQLAPGGRLFASMLVTDRPIGRTYLAMLQRRGEVVRPRHSTELATAAHDIFGESAEVSCTGSMAWLRAAVPSR